MGKCLEGSLVAPAPGWCGGSGGPWLAHEAADFNICGFFPVVPVLGQQWQHFLHQAWRGQGVQ